MSTELLVPLDAEPVRRLAYDRAEAALAIGVSSRTVWELTRRGEIPHVRLGAANGRVIYPIRELERWLSDRAAKNSSAAVN